MGNSESNCEYAGGLADSPTKRLDKYTVFEFKVSSTPANQQLPGKVKAVFTEGHVEFWNLPLTKMYNALSYYAVASWAHGSESFNINLAGTDGPTETKSAYCFKTVKGEAKKAAETISGYVHMIMADNETKEADERMKAKEKQWEQIFRTPDKKKKHSMMDKATPELPADLLCLQGKSPEEEEEELDEFFNAVPKRSAQVA